MRLAVPLKLLPSPEQATSLHDTKCLVRTAQCTKRGLALEDLEGIRSRIKARRSQRRILHSWSFHQLRQLVAYKAALAGVPVVYEDPRNTSRTCPDPACGLVDARNRPTQARFECVECVACGLAGPADIIAAKNIRVRGRAVCEPAVRGGSGVLGRVGQCVEAPSCKSRPLELAVGLLPGRISARRRACCTTPIHRSTPE